MLDSCSIGALFDIASGKYIFLHHQKVRIFVVSLRPPAPPPSFAACGPCKFKCNPTAPAEGHWNRPLNLRANISATVTKCIRGLFASLNAWFGDWPTFLGCRYLSLSLSACAFFARIKNSICFGVVSGIYSLSGLETHRIYNLNQAQNMRSFEPDNRRDCSSLVYLVFSLNLYKVT